MSDLELVDLRSYRILEEGTPEWEEWKHLLAPGAQVEAQAGAQRPNLISSHELSLSAETAHIERRTARLIAREREGPELVEIRALGDWHTTQAQAHGEAAGWCRSKVGVLRQNRKPASSEAGMSAAFKRRPLIRAEDRASTEQVPVSAPAPVETKPEAKPAEPKGWPDPPKAPEGATELERLTYPEGLLGHVVQYIMDSYRLPDRLMALTGAIFACTIALARKVLPPGETNLALYILVIAQSGAGKQHILNCLRILLRAMGREDALVGTGIASVQSIDQILEGTGENNPGRPLALVSIDEYGSSFLARIASKGQTGNVSEIPGKLQTLWALPPDLEYQGDIKVDKKRPPVHGPAFFIFGTSTESSFFGALKQKNFSSGFVNRHLVINAGRGALKPVLRTKCRYSECPEWLMKALKQIAGEPAPRDNRPLKKDGVVFREFRRIGWGAGAEEMFYNFECEMRAIPSEKDRDVGIRAPEIALRIATVHAVFRGSQVIDLMDAVWAIALARRSLGFITKGTSKHMLEEYEQADLVEYIRDEFRRKGRLSQGQVRKYCERKCKDHRQIDAGIHHLLITEEIIEIDGEVRPGRPTHTYEWQR